MFEVWALSIIFLIVLVLPFRVRWVEHNLGPFLFLMGLIAATVTWSWDWHLVEEAATTPIPITAAVLIAGSVVHIFHQQLQRLILWISDRISLRLFIFLVVVFLGLASSIISAIIAALFLVTVLEILPLVRRSRINITVIACFAIGMGAVLTPLGEPLSTITVSALEGEPYYAGFFFLTDLLGYLVVPGVVAMGFLAASPLILSSSSTDVSGGLQLRESYREVIKWCIKIFVFVAALVLLGESFSVLIEKYFIKLDPWILYWINTVSAILDNATLAAAEIGPALSVSQIKVVLISLMISGGMLIPGNIPNIIAADKLQIGMREWARVAVPIGVVLLSVYFVVVFYIL